MEPLSFTSQSPSVAKPKALVSSVYVAVPGQQGSFVRLSDSSPRNRSLGNSGGAVAPSFAAALASSSPASLRHSIPSLRRQSLTLHDFSRNTLPDHLEAVANASISSSVAASAASTDNKAVEAPPSSVASPATSLLNLHLADDASSHATSSPNTPNTPGTPTDSSASSRGASPASSLRKRKRLTTVPFELTPNFHKSYDVKFVLGEEKVELFFSSFALEVHSSVFRQLFAAEQRPITEKVVVMPHESPADFAQFLLLLIPLADPNAQLTHEHVWEVARLAHTYACHALLAAVDRWLSAHGGGNAVPSLSQQARLARRYSLDRYAIISESTRQSRHSSFSSSSLDDTEDAEYVGVAMPPHRRSRKNSAASSSSPRGGNSLASSARSWRSEHSSLRMEAAAPPPLPPSNNPSPPGQQALSPPSLPSSSNTATSLTDAAPPKSPTSSKTKSKREKRRGKQPTTTTPLQYQQQQEQQSTTAEPVEDSSMTSASEASKKSSPCSRCSTIGATLKFRKRGTTVWFMICEGCVDADPELRGLKVPLLQSK